MKQISLTLTVDGKNRMNMCDLLADTSGLPKSRIKRAMTKGAVWRKSKAGKRRRIRRAVAIPSPGDVIEIYYNEAVLSVVPPLPECISDQHHYSVWYKPAGLMTQGSRFGDHCSLLRQVDLKFGLKRRIYPVHRLDREASGLVLLAHDKTAAARLSDLFHRRRIEKIYMVEVLGNPGAKGLKGVIDHPLDGQTALTEYEVLAYAPDTNSTRVRVSLKTGRRHQIRRHFDLVGFPVMGDPRYGRGNKNSDGMKLTAVSLAFSCPYRGGKVVFELPPGICRP